MKKLLTLATAIIGLFMAHGAFATIYPVHSACVGSFYTLYDSTAAGGVSTGGVWSSSNPTVASVHPTAGSIWSHAAGTTTIAYTGGTLGTISMAFTVYPLPAPITGGGGALICAGSTLTLSTTTSGGTWYSPSGAATVGITSGVVTGVHTGSTLITYTTPFGCTDTSSVHVLGAPADSIYGATAVCVGSTATLTSYTSGGTWFSSATSIATVSSGGVVTGIAPGTAMISHTVSNACGTTVATRTMTVTSTTYAGTISGSTTVAVGSTTTLSSSVTGGTWTSGSTSIATISGSGVVTGVAGGTTVITYTVTGCTGPASTTTTLTVPMPNCIEGNVLFTGASYSGPVKIWLIKYDATTHLLTAVDTMSTFCSGTSAHYSFCGLGTDSFRIKASCPDTPVAATGYLPTYHTASAFWHSATVIYHVSGTHDINKNITMAYGTPTSGPGFIAGDVTAGANKGTVDFLPAPGIKIFAVNNATGAILQQTNTDAAGHYSFTSLPVDMAIKIYPELINYATTAFPLITLTTANPGKLAANFEQHTVSLTITPKPASVISTPLEMTGVSVFPNPASGAINMEWSIANAGTGTVVITDITGRQVYSSTVNMTQNSGNAHISLDGISRGLYMISVKANGVNYNNKIEIQ